MKFNIGDKVKIVNYGHPYWEGGQQKDMQPEIIGKIGIIQECVMVQGQSSYSIYGIPEKHAWYDGGQLELIYANPNTL